MPSLRRSLLALVASSALTLQLASAHGMITRIEADGVSYEGYDGWHDSAKSGVSKIVRKKETTTAVTDLSSPDMNCGLGNNNTPAALVADVTAGSNITVQWGPAIGQYAWPKDHDGPIMMYAADCQGNCTTFVPKGDSWAKIFDIGLGADGQFVDTELQNGAFSFPVPESLASGQYLFQFTILAVHRANNPEFYPQCAQFNVKSSGTTAFSSLERVDMTKVYLSDVSKAGVYVDLWNVPEHIKTQKWSTYAMPGPAALYADSPDEGGADGNDASSSSVVPSASASSTTLSTSASPTTRSTASSATHATPTSPTSVPTRTASSLPEAPTATVTVTVTITATVPASSATLSRHFVRWA